MSYSIDIPIKTKHRSKLFWICPRCKVNTLESKGQRISCPRNLNCEAIEVGKINITTTTEVRNNINKLI